MATFRRTQNESFLVICAQIVMSQNSWIHAQIAMFLDMCSYMAKSIKLSEFFALSKLDKIKEFRDLLPRNKKMWQNFNTI